MSNWHTLLVKYFAVSCSERESEEFNDFDEACERAEELQDEFPNAVVEVSALLDVLG